MQKMTSGIKWFNTLSYLEAERALSAVCRAPSFVAGMLAARPVSADDDLLTMASRVLAALPDTEVDAAVAAYPKITEGPVDPSDEHAALELAPVVESTDPALLHALVEANAAYEAKFGRAYLAYAAGTTGHELLTILQDRLTNDETTEREISRAELGKIATRRLERLLDKDA